MNKFEQEVDYILDYVPVSVDKAIQSISALHEKEIIAFAEWCERHYYRLDNGNWIHRQNRDYTKPFTTSELLTIFRNQQK